jgi:hypothetical protein
MSFVSVVVMTILVLGMKMKIPSLSIKVRNPCQASLKKEMEKQFTTKPKKELNMHI